MIKGTRCPIRRAEQGQVTGIEGSPAGLVATRRLRPRGLASRTGAASTGVAAGADSAALSACAAEGESSEAVSLPWAENEPESEAGGSALSAESPPELDADKRLDAAATLATSLDASLCLTTGGRAARFSAMGSIETLMPRPLQ